MEGPPPNESCLAPAAGLHFQLYPEFHQISLYVGQGVGFPKPGRPGAAGPASAAAVRGAGSEGLADLLIVGMIALQRNNYGLAAETS